MTRPVWVVADIRNETLLFRSLGVLAAARALAGELGAETRALVFSGARDPGCPDPAEAASRLAVLGSPAVILKNPALDPHRPDLLARALAAAVAEDPPSLVLFPLTGLGRETAARAAARLGAGLIADCASLSVENGRVVASCPSWGGRVLARIAFSDPRALGFATVAPSAALAPEPAAVPGKIEEREIAFPLPKRAPRVLSRGPVAVEAGDLADARAVVVGGAGLGSVEGFGLARELAAVLGGQAGATRPPVLAHWADEDRLIGQTGRAVKPELLVCAGVSGAVQFTAGVGESGFIVAVNRDPAAPIFGLADLGVVADARAFLPAFTEKVKEAVFSRLAETVCETAGEAREGLGAKVRSLREGLSWTVEALAQATGQTPEFVEKVETDEVVPSVSFILRLARALKTDPAAFLGADARAEIRDRRSRAFLTRTQNYSYQTLTPGAENEHLRAFAIEIEPRQAHKPVAYKHEGEEFVYVLAGVLELTLDTRAHTLKPGESVRFNSEIPHKLRSLSDATTRLLVVLYTP